MSLHRLTAGNGYQYLLRHTARGDADRAATEPLTAYYAHTGYPPGRWLGAGLTGVDDGAGLPAGSPVGEEQMAALFGHGCDPVTGAPLGRRYPTYRPSQDGRTTPTAVAGFDLTFTVPKSASVLWALADPTTQRAIVDAHHTAVEETLAFLEERALFTRTGAGGCAQVPTRGMLAAGFDHWDTRTGDPNLHTHVVIANKVQGPDGRWRSIDSKALHHATVAVSEVYDDLFADHLAAGLPVTWQWRHRGSRLTPAHELVGIPDPLLEVFSTRSHDIDTALRSALREFRDQHHRPPTRGEILRLRQHATRATRPGKTVQPLPELMTRWRDTATRVTGQPPEHLVHAALGHPETPLTAGEVPDEVVDRISGHVLEELMRTRSTWTPWNVTAETARLTRGLRMATTTDRVRLLDRVQDRVLGVSTSLQPDPVPALPGPYRRPDGTSVFTRPGEHRYTHQHLLDAEHRLLTATNTTGAPTVEESTARRIATAPQSSPSGAVMTLGPDQAEAVTAIATSDRQVDVLVGPAGSGKTMTLRALRTVWQATHGPGSVLGLAPSATAAHELGTALGVPCENTAKWLYETRGSTTQTGDRRWALPDEGLLIVDEASLAGTLDLDQLRQQAHEAGCKMLLVGDHHQLSAVTAGGAFGLLAEKGGSANELWSLWRFRHRWEAHATRRLRHGDPDVAHTYTSHGRVHTGPAETMLDAAYTAWQSHQTDDRASILLAADQHTVNALNSQAHHDRLTTGHVHGTPVALRDGVCAAVGDRVITRRNDRTLTTSGGGHVRNGQLWTVTGTHPDGSITATPHNHPDGAPGREVRLPARYVAQHVDLGYATTIHRAQGITVAHSHVLATPTMTREALYVAMTRGSASNTLYLTTDTPDPTCDQPPDTTPERTPTEVLQGILARRGAEQAATTIQANGTDPQVQMRHLARVRVSLATDTETGDEPLTAQTRQALDAVDQAIRARHAAPTEGDGPQHSLRRRAERDLPPAEELPVRQEPERTLHR